MPKVFVKRTASQQLAEQIHQQIEQGAWAVGDTMPSMRSLAARYRVSLATVQKAMHELGNREVIKLLPRQGGIVQSSTSANNRSKNLIGIVVGLDRTVQIPLWWTHQIIHHAQLTLAESDYVLTLLNFNVDKPDYVRQVRDQMNRIMESLAGMIFFSDHGIDELADELDQIEMPWMTVNPLDLETHHNYVMADQLSAGRLVGRCFAKLGYQRVAVLYDELNGISPLEKVTGIYQGYLVEGKSAAGIEQVVCKNMETEAGYVAMRQHLTSHQPPQGVFATADTLAIGAMRACQEIGLRVPQDVGVVGSTGMPSSVIQSDPPLTELRQPVEAIGRQLALCLQEMIRGGVRRISGRRVPASLIVQKSLPLTKSICQELGIPLDVKIPATPSRPEQAVSAVI
ncbi:MAG: GntR family transcriptional regulator [Phycisphaerales bacterium]|jgi:DNA-binding LacI/PurR family transcriptional regulator|nr:GntR family transcriptional regulator [Phycisphaerales bacterium]